MDNQKERDFRSKILAGLAQKNFHVTMGRNLLVRKLNEEGVPITYDAFYEILWRLVAEGLIAIDPQFNNDRVIVDFKLRLTERGQHYLESEGEYQPDDPDGYMKLIADRLPSLDHLVNVYLREAVFSYRAKCFLASVVMLGCASERIIVLLGEVYISAYRDKVSQKFKDLFMSQKTNFGDKLTALRNQLGPLRNELPQSVQQKYMDALQSMAELIRHTRNEAGHPSGIEISQDQTRIFLTTSAYYFEILHTLNVHFEA